MTEDYIAYARFLVSKGYRRVSNSYKTVARVDRPDWVQFMYAEVFKHRANCVGQLLDFYAGRVLQGFTTDSVLKEAQQAADHYRRCYSKDKIDDVPSEVFKLIPSSNWDETGYIEVSDGLVNISKPLYGDDPAIRDQKIVETLKEGIEHIEYHCDDDDEGCAVAFMQAAIKMLGGDL